MTLLTDKKAEQEKLAEIALQSQDFGAAFSHTAHAAKLAYELAAATEGVVSQAYIENGGRLTTAAEQLQDASEKQLVEQAKTPAGAGKDTVQASQWQMTEKPDVRLDDVAGLTEVKAALQQDAILPFEFPEVYERYKLAGGGGVLMYGPPGTGKTFIAKAVAGELNAAFFSVDPSQIKGKYVGETEKNMRALFEAARQHERAVIFFDEVHSLLPKQRGTGVNAVTMFLTMMDGITSDSGKTILLVLGATNHPNMIDPAALRSGRFSKHIYVGLPDVAARESIAHYCFRDVPLADGFPFAEAATRMEGFSGADVAAVCKQTKAAVAMRDIKESAMGRVGGEDLFEAISDFTPTVSKKDVAKFDDWRAKS